MKTIVPTCPRCGATRVRCTGCGAYHGYGHPLGCAGVACHTTAAPSVCRCGQVDAPVS
jgi:hypothetical protein